MKKTIAITLSLIFMTASSFSLSSCNDKYAGGFYYSLNKDNTITVYVNEYNMTELVIPDSIDGFRVSSIKAPKKSSNANNILEEIYFPESIVEIGKNAFKGCVGIETLNLPTKLTVINDSAFEACSSLIEVRLPKGLTTVENEAFKNCSGLLAAYIPDTVSLMGAFAFKGCPNLDIYVGRDKPGFFTGGIWGQEWSGNANVHWNYDGYNE